MSSPQNVTEISAVFRGDTLVGATPFPTEGILRYQRNNLLTLPVTDVAAPKVNVLRFVRE